MHSQTEPSQVKDNPCLLIYLHEIASFKHALVLLASLASKSHFGLNIKKQARNKTTNKPADDASIHLKYFPHVDKHTCGKSK